MRRMRYIAVLVGALLSMGGFIPSASAVGELTGRVVHETVPPVFDYVTDPITGIIDTVIVSAPGYEGVSATVIAYGPGQGGGPADLVASVLTNADGTFSIPGLTDAVYLEVHPTSSDWQSGWLWVDAMTDWPGFASLLQQAPPSTFDVTPGMDVGMLAPTIAVASGRVVDLTTGDPIAGATVRYEPVDNGRRTPTATTNAEGYYSMRGLDYEEYHIRASARRYIAGYVGAEFLLYPPGEGSTWSGGQLAGDIKMASR